MSLKMKSVITIQVLMRTQALQMYLVVRVPKNISITKKRKYFWGK